MFSGSCLQTATHSHRMRTECSPSLRSSESMTPPSNGPVSGEIRLAGPRPLSAVTQLFKGWQRAEACQFNFGRPRAPWATMDTKNEAVWERGKKINFCCAVVVCSTADTSSVLAYFCPACGQHGFWSVKQRRTAKRIYSPLSFAIPSAMSVTAKNVVLMRVVIKVLRNICGNGLWLWLPNH